MKKQPHRLSSSSLYLTKNLRLEKECYTNRLSVIAVLSQVTEIK